MGNISYCRCVAREQFPPQLSGPPKIPPPGNTAFSPLSPRHNNGYNNDVTLKYHPLHSNGTEHAQYGVVEQVGEGVGKCTERYGGYGCAHSVSHWVFGAFFDDGASSSSFCLSP